MALSRLFAAAMIVVSIGTAQAQEGGKASSRDRELLRRALANQKQAEDARAGLAAEKAALETKLETLQKQLAAIESERDRERRRAAGLQAGVAASGRDLENSQREKSALAERLARTEASLRQSEETVAALELRLEAAGQDTARLEASVASLASAGDQCREKNAQLHEVASQLLSKYRTVGFWDILKRREPFTGLERVKVGNLLEELADRADAARIVDRK